MWRNLKTSAYPYLSILKHGNTVIFKCLQFEFSCNTFSKPNLIVTDKTF